MKTAAPARTTGTPTPERSAQLFHALSDATRLAILDMLRDGERCVCDLQDALDAAQSRLSFHLKVLRDVGLVSDRKDGRWSYYTANRERLADAEQAVAELARPRSGLVALRRSARVRNAVHASAVEGRERGCC